MLQKLQTSLEQRIQSNHYRCRQLTNDRHLNFSSNDYLGLSQHPKVIAAYQKAATDYGVGSGSAYLVTGFSRPHQLLEEELAEFLQMPRVLLFSSGYMANYGVLSTLIKSNDIVFADKLCHASIIDGCLTTQAKLIRYPHCDINKLQQVLPSDSEKNKFFISEGVFSMEGSLVDPAFFAMAQDSNAWVYLDDAHGIGILGKNGQGSLGHFKVPYHHNMIVMGTLSKAFGSYGGFVASNAILIETLIQFARPYIYTTAIPPAVVEASRASLKVMQEEDWRRQKLFELVAYFRHVAQQLNISTTSNTAIQPIIIGDASKTIAISKNLAAQGIIAKAILPPTVPVNTSRLRISLSALHEKQQLDYFFDSFENACKKM